MKSILTISKNTFLCLLLTLVVLSTNTLAQNQPASSDFKLYSFNSKIPLGSVPASRIADISYLGADEKWANVRIQGGIPAWLKLENVTLLPNNSLRISSPKARIYIEPKKGSRYLMTLSKGFTSSILAVNGSWYQVSTPSYLTLKMLESKYRSLIGNQVAPNPVVPTEKVAEKVTIEAQNATVVNNSAVSAPTTVIATELTAAVLPKPQNTISNDPIANSEPSRSAYFLTPGDVISISVFGEPDMVLSNQRVGESGFVSFPLIGQVAIKGKTTQQVETMIESMLSKGYLRDPKVNVVINAYRPLYVRGAVNAPGSYDFTEGLTVAKVLTLAGGITKGAVTDTLKLYRNDELFLQNLTIDSQTLIQSGDILTVEEGIGTVEKASSFIYLHGEVNSPGGYEYREGLTVEKAIALAGGFSPRASKKKIDITRETVDQEEPEKIKRVKLFFDLKPGDVIHIGASWF